MENTTKVEIQAAGKTITFESGVLAQQAAGSVTLQMGETIVFSAVTAAKEPREGIDFFPLQIEYREKFYAAGRFPGGFFKREARPSEKEILTMRATDRPIRPLFPEGYHNEVQINNALLSTDGQNDPDILCINAASTSLTLSEIPFMGPVGAVRVGRVNNEFVINPTHEELEQSDLNLTYVGNREFPLMIEGDAKEIGEDAIVAAMKLAHETVVKLIDAQLELRKALGLPDKVVVVPEVDQTYISKAREIAGAELQEALLIAGKQERHDKVDEIKAALKERMSSEDEEMTAEQFRFAFHEIEVELVRKNVTEKGQRPDGRSFDDLRQLAAQVSFLPRTHGSALFNRGETQALATVTLGTMKDGQSLDAVAGGPTEKTFLLHYNFPPYSVGEVGRLGMTNRREIGHGNLAERSLAPVIPDDYPYSVRVVSEVMGSNGSSSMASVCVGTLALMDAGVPIKRPVAGISIGLFTGEGDKAELVTDILGTEDHCGDMDFKVAGTREGITGFQVDLKIHGLRWDLVEGAFTKAREARLKILDYMGSVLDSHRDQMSEHAPRIETVQIQPDKIGALIGPGGKNIRRITDTTGTQIDIQDDGTVSIFSSDKDAMEAALHEVGLITAEAEVGKTYRGTVSGVKDFGAFVEILPGKDGLVHISELADYRVGSVSDICKPGDEMWVKCIDVDDTGRIRLSRKAALAEMDAKTEEEPSPTQG